jgi:preprotein translocase subunit SecD
MFLLLTSCKDEPAKLPVIQDRHPLLTGWYHISTVRNNFPRSYFKENGKSYYVHPRPILLAQHFTSISIDTGIKGQKGPSMQIKFDDFGRESFAHATSVPRGNKLAFIVGDELVTVAEVKNKITKGDVTIRGYTSDELRVFEMTIQNERRGRQ